MVPRILALILASISLALSASVVWHPSPDWQDRSDPIASPHARKGGTIRFNGSQPPKSFNAYVDNNAYTKMTFDLMYENLLGIDNQTMEFVPLLARRWAISSDGREFTFVIDDRAVWSDGKPVTAHDVKWTFDQVMDPKSDTGSWKVMLGAFESPKVVDEHTVVFSKKGDSPKDWRDILNCSMFWIMPRHVFEGCDFNKLDLVGAVVGGPYMITRVAEQVETEFGRVKTWWRKDFQSCRYTCNFDRIVIRYFVDNENAFEALKKRAIDIYPVYTARIMAKETHGEKFDRNWILKRRVRNHDPIGFQGFAMNMRRWPFNDVRVRKAIARLIDRDTMNRTMMFNEYFLMNSYYTDLYDSEHPCTNDFAAFDVAAAQALLAEAGFVKDAKDGLLKKDGKHFRFAFLSRSGTEDKFLALFTQALEACGIRMDIVRKDFAGWMRDMDGFNFDMTWAAWGSSLFKYPETMWLGAEADRKGSNNIVGFRSDEVDRIIAAEKSMETMAERLVAYRKIDSLIAAECPYAFLWNTDVKRLLYWNKFGMPSTILSKYSGEESILTYWWYDTDKAKELDEAISHGECLPKVPLEIDFDTVVGR